MSRKASANLRRRLVALQQLVGAVLDHPPCRQVGQFVIIGRTEQLILDRLQFGDVGGGRQQQTAVGDPNRPMGREQDLLVLAVADGFFGRPRRGRNAAIRGRFRGDAPVPCEVRPAPVVVIPSCAAAASLTSRKRPCSSCTVTPPGSNLKTSRSMPSSPSAARSMRAFRWRSSADRNGDGFAWSPSLPNSLLVLVK